MSEVIDFDKEKERIREQLEALERRERTEKARTKRSVIEFPFVAEGIKGTRPETRIANTKALLDHYGITVRYNEMSKDTEIGIADMDFNRDTALNAQFIEVHDRCRHHGYMLGKDELDRHLMHIANQNTYHPVREWILSAPWDGVSRLPALYETVEHDENVSTGEIKERFIRKWLIQAVAAVFEPRGIATQGMLVFVGKQGLGKTTWIKRLVPTNDWVKDGALLNPNDKDSVLEVVSHWIVELGELSSTLRKADIDALKAFVTKQEDMIRPAYAPKFNRYPRRTVLYGSVDDPRFLVDKENRRFWTLGVTKLHPFHDIDIQQLWAEVYSLWQENPDAYIPTREDIDDLKRSNVEFETVNPVFEALEAHVVDPQTFNSDDPVLRVTASVERLNATTILTRCGRRNPTRRDVTEASFWLRERGFRFAKEGNSRLYHVILFGDMV